MSILKDIHDILFPPKEPVYDVSNLIFSYKEHESHVEKAREILTTLLWNTKYALVLKDDGELNPTELLGRVKYTWSSIIDGWVNDEFIPKIQRFSIRGLPSTRTNSVIVVKDGMNLVDNARRHVEAARVHGVDMIAAIRFFLCDTRSSFNKGASLDDGKCSARDVCDWYVGGLDNVKRNVARIDDALTRTLDFVNTHYKGD